MPSLLDILLSNDAARAICWTLVHSLWEGAIAALAAGAIILATRKQPAALRYNLLIATIALFIIAAGATFIYELKPHQQTSRPLDNTTAYVIQTQTPQTNTPIEAPSANTFTVRTALQRINDFLNTNATLVTGIWLGCLLAQLLRLSGGLFKLHRLRHHSTIPATAFWKTQLDALARQLGIKRTVTLLQSRSVKAPSAFGFLKPAILVPLGFLAQLPAQQVETILLHELAHIRRNDYLSNIILHLTEAVFFFNPGIRWIATLIRREREACCDDIVLARTPDRHNYFEALVAFTQLTIDGHLGKPRHTYQLQLGGSRRSDLLWRVRRMLEKENKRLHLLEKTILSFALFALVSFSLVKPRPAMISKPATQVRPKINAATNQKSPVQTKPAISAASAINAAPAATLATPATAPATPAVPAIAAPAPPAPVVPAISAPAPPPPAPPVPLVPPANPDTAPEKIKFTAIEHNVHSEGNGHRYDATAQASDGHTYTICKHNERVLFFKIDGRFLATEEYLQHLEVLAAFDKDAWELVHPDNHTAPANSDLPDSIRGNKSAPTPEHPVIWSPAPDINILHIALDLIKIHLLPDLNNYSFYLDSYTFTVNGVPVPDNIAQQFRKKYVLGLDYNFEYSQRWSPGSSGAHCIVHTPNHSANLTSQY